MIRVDPKMKGLKVLLVTLSFLSVSCNDSKSPAPATVNIFESVLTPAVVYTGSKTYFKANVQAGNPYTIGLVGFTDTEIKLEQATDASFTQSASTAVLDGAAQSVIELRIPNASAEVYFVVDGSQVKSMQEFNIAIVSAIEETTFINEGLPTVPIKSILVEQNTPTMGQVAGGGMSFYRVTNTTPGKSFRIAIFGLTGDADLRVYESDTYSVEIDATLNQADVTTNDAEDCLYVSPGDIYFSVNCGPANANGAGFYIVVSPSE